MWHKDNSISIYHQHHGITTKNKLLASLSECEDTSWLGNVQIPSGNEWQVWSDKRAFSRFHVFKKTCIYTQMFVEKVYICVFYFCVTQTVVLVPLHECYCCNPTKEIISAPRVALPLRNVCMTNSSLVRFHFSPKKWHAAPHEYDALSPQLLKSPELSKRRKFNHQTPALKISKPPLAYCCPKIWWWMQRL